MPSIIILDHLQRNPMPRRLGKHGHLLILLIVFFGGTPIPTKSQAAVRLSSGNAQLGSCVEVFYNDTWHNLCRTGFGTAEARVVCRQLGLPFTAAEPCTISDLADQGETVQMSCRGDEMSVLQCNLAKLGAPCEDAKVAGVKCIATGPPATINPYRPQQPPLTPAVSGSSCQGTYGCQPLQYSPPRPSPTQPLRSPVLTRPSPRRPPRPRPPPPKRDAPPSNTTSATAISCSVSLIGRRPPAGSSKVSILNASVNCDMTSRVTIGVGRQLLPFISKWSGLALDSSLRPDDAEWGITLGGVPYLRLMNSVVRDLPLSTAGPLLQVVNVSKLELQNVAVSGLWSPASTPAVYGPLHAAGITSATLTDVSCTNVRNSHGWGCMMLQYDTTNVTSTASSLLLAMANSTFRNVVVARGGQYGSSSPAGGAAGFGAVVVSSTRLQQVVAESPSGLALINVTMRGVLAESNTGGSGAVFASLDLELAPLSLGNCSFVKNKAFGTGLDDGSGYGGAIFSAVTVNELVLSGGTVISNNAASFGGGVASASGLVKITVTEETKLTNNSATRDGGAIWVRGALGTATLTGSSSACGNRASGSGGVLAAVGGVDRLEMSDNCWLAGNMAGLHGGVALLRGRVAAVRLMGGCMLWNNKALQGDGGALCLQVLPSHSSLLTLDNAWLQGNLAGRSGGALALGRADDANESSAPPLETPVSSRPAWLSNALWAINITSSNLSNNTANLMGGAVVAVAANSALRVRISSSRLLGNRAGLASKVNMSAEPAITGLAGDGLSGDGGAVALAGQPSIENTWVDAFVPNECKNQKGPDLFSSAGPLPRSCGAEIRDSIFADGATGGSGGALHLRLCRALVAGSSFSRNRAAVSGGALAAVGLSAKSGEAAWSTSDWTRTLVVRDTDFLNNWATGLHGGAVAVMQGGVLELCNCTLAGNTAAENGGGIAALFPPMSVNTSIEPMDVDRRASGVELTFCRIESNMASIRGGGIFAEPLGMVSLQRCEVVENAAASSGGGIYVAETRLLKIKLVERSAVSMVAVAETVLDKNFAGGDGGGMSLVLRNAAQVTLTNMTLTSNHATLLGGGLAVSASRDLPYVPVTATDCVFGGNKADGGSDAMYLSPNIIWQPTRVTEIGNTTRRVV